MIEHSTQATIAIQPFRLFPNGNIADADRGLSILLGDLVWMTQVENRWLLYKWHNRSYYAWRLAGKANIWVRPASPLEALIKGTE